MEEQPPAACGQEERVGGAHTESARVEEEEKQPRELNTRGPESTQPAGKCRENIHLEVEEARGAAEEAAVRCVE